MIRKFFRKEAVKITSDMSLPVTRISKSSVCPVGMPFSFFGKILTKIKTKSGDVNIFGIGI